MIAATTQPIESYAKPVVRPDPKTLDYGLIIQEIERISFTFINPMWSRQKVLHHTNGMLYYNVKTLMNILGITYVFIGSAYEIYREDQLYLLEVGAILKGLGYECSEAVP